MKKRYQIRKRRAAESFRDWAATNQKPIQLTFPTQGMAELAERSLGDLLRSVGKLFIETVLDNEVEEVVGQRGKLNRNRRAYRWGTDGNGSNA